MEMHHQLRERLCSLEPLNPARLHFFYNRERPYTTEQVTFVTTPIHVYEELHARAQDRSSHDPGNLF